MLNCVIKNFQNMIKIEKLNNNEICKIDIFMARSLRSLAGGFVWGYRDFKSEGVVL